MCSWVPRRWMGFNLTVVVRRQEPISYTLSPGPWFNIKMSSYQYRKSHCRDKTVVRSSYLHNGISYTGKMTSLYWFIPQNTGTHSIDCVIHSQYYVCWCPGDAWSSPYVHADFWTSTTNCSCISVARNMKLLMYNDEKHINFFPQILTFLISCADILYKLLSISCWYFRKTIYEENSWFYTLIS